MDDDESSCWIDAVTYVCADVLLVPSLKRTVAKAFLDKVLWDLDEDWVAGIVDYLCKNTCDDDDILRAPLLKMLLEDKYEKVQSYASLAKVLQEYVPLAWHLAAKTSEMVIKCGHLAAQLEIAASDTKKLNAAVVRAGDTRKVVDNISDLLSTSQPLCKACRAKIKDSYGYFQIHRLGIDTDGNTIEPPSYYVLCHGRDCQYRQFLN